MSFTTKREEYKKRMRKGRISSEQKHSAEITVERREQENETDSGASAGQGACGDKRYCITLSEVEITAEAGLCVVIPCIFTIADNFNVKRVIWYKCDQGKTKCDSDIIFDTNNINKNQTGRVSLLEPDLSKKNCSIIINDLTKSDSGSYQLRVTGTLGGKQDRYTFPNCATISVKDLSSKPKVMVPVLIEGRQTTLTCTAPGLCSGSVPTITWMWRGTGQNKTKIENLTAVSQRHSSTLTFNPLAEQHGTQVTCKVSFTGNKTTEETVTLNMTYIKITGNTTVKKGDALNLTCSVVGFSPSSITWTEPSSNKKHNGTKTDMHNNTGSNLKNDTKAKLKDDTGTKGGTDTQNKTVTQMQKTTGTLTLIIPRMSSEHSDRYICTAKYLNTTLTKYADITVNWYPEILNNSTCKKSSRSTVVTCVCISEGLPLPTITWPLVKNHTEYSVITTVSKHTVNSTITVSVTDHSNTTIKCVSRNDIGGAEVNLSIIKTEWQEGNMSSSWD
ncbi:sialic acid-binding Ig-like lectin 5 [Thunnus albacares]|uniref:sialic acid-binding Ig-like lectin 5 n=1 Tax=Thunnus albacares TaxID=8236 RepID=UPI001CF6A8AB|nr:sialic acid-binding Ig-like lectin 5 [Thunnus albacares]